MEAIYGQDPNKSILGWRLSSQDPGLRSRAVMRHAGLLTGQLAGQSEANLGEPTEGLTPPMPPAGRVDPAQAAAAQRREQAFHADNFFNTLGIGFGD